MEIKYIVLLNIITFLAMYKDKRNAIENKWRVSEKAFLTAALAGGAVGIYFGMYTFRHKTKKNLFRIGMPVIIIIQILLYLFI